MEIFEYSFFQNALAALLLVGIASAVVGTYVVARRMMFVAGGAVSYTHLLGYNERQVYEIKQPERFGLPAPNISTKYIFTTNRDFFGALHLIVGLEAVAEQLFLDLNSLLDGQADAAVDCLLAVAYSDGCVLCDLAGQLQHVLHQLSLRIHSVHQTNAQSLVCLDVRCV